MASSSSPMWLLQNISSLLLLLLLSASSSFLLLQPASANPQLLKQYIVYMGSTSPSSNGSSELDPKSDYLQMLSSITESDGETRGLVHHYKHAFRGFSAMLTQVEASAFSGQEGVVSVFRDPILNTILGLLGVEGSGRSLRVSGFGEIPSRWKGTCMEAPNFQKSNCNRKLIGARYYVTTDDGDGTPSSAGSPRDSIGHGTHTASTAAGSLVDNASYYGLARGTARGGAPSARIAVYNACSEDGCSGSAILKAIDDAIEDGVDLISISIGISSALQSDYLSDPIAIGGFHAQERGVTVVCSAGNDGPRPHTVVNSAPWIFTAAASNIDRDFQSTLVLGNGKSFKGSAISFSNLSSSKTYPLVFGAKAAASSTPISESSNCYPGSLEKDKVAGKIVICLTNDTSITRRIRKLVVEDAGGIGMIQINQEETSVPFDAGTFPFVAVGSRYGTRILNYMNRDKNPKATILATVDVPGHRPAPSVARFFSRGPVSLTENLLKPDVTAPGVSILAAVNPTNEPGTVPIGQNPSGYALRSGTSMACPHVAGAAALIKSLHPKWSPSMIRSALMTTATIYNNMGKRMTNTSTQTATPHETGAGEINPTKALNPGLVFHTTTLDYLQFLCYYGYSNRMIRSLSPRTKFTCPSNSKNKQSLMSSINYPSISIARLARGATQTTVRTVTNVGPVNSTYFAIANAAGGLKAEVVPRKLVFTHGVQKLSFRVVFSATEASLLGYSFGYVTWRDRSLHHSVRLVFAVNVE